MIAVGSEIVRRPATATDEPYLRALFADSRDDLARLPAQVREPLIDLQFSAQRAQQRASYPDASHEILVFDGRDVGQVVLADCHIVDITVDRTDRRRGIASAVLRDVIARNCPDPTTLHVWAANTAARALYAGLDFESSDDGEGYLTMVHRCEP